MPLPRSLSRRACNNGDQLALATPCCAAPASVLLQYIIMESSGQRIHNFGADPGAPGRLSRTHSRSGSGDRHCQPNEVTSPPFTWLYYTGYTGYKGGRALTLTVFERLPPPLNDRRPILPPLASRTAAAAASRTGRSDIWPSLTYNYSTSSAGCRSSTRRNWRASRGNHRRPSTEPWAASRPTASSGG